MILSRRTFGCVAFWVFLGVVPVCAIAEEPAAAPVPVERSQVLKDLASDRFQERVDAQNRLSELVKAEPEHVAFLAGNASTDVAIRIVSALELVFLKNPNAEGDRAEQALMLLSEEPAPLGPIARNTLLTHSRLREDRARIAITALGGEFSYINPFKADPRQMVYRKLATAPGTGVGFGPPALLSSVWLHEDWKGTSNDLWHIARLIHCPDLALYSIRGNGVDLNDLYRLVSVVPGLSIAERGPCLGIRSAPFGGENCEVGEVLRYSSAAKAGIRRGDVIYELNGNDIRSFSHLVEKLQEYSIGDDVIFSIRRYREDVEVPVHLGSWRGIAQGSDEYAPAPPPFQGPFGTLNKSSTPPPVPLPQVGIILPL